MVSALLYIFMGQGRETKQQTSCMNILNTMYKIMRQARLLESAMKQKDPSYVTVTNDDLQKLLKTESQKKYEMEKSYVYIGYKFLWIIQMFLDGKRFPYGDLTERQW